MNDMRFLVIDTAGPSLRVALSTGAFVRDGNNRNASAALMPAVDELLCGAKCTLADLDFAACVTGPGSFTGIRIGVSTVRSLCYARGLPALGMHYLQTLAYNERADGSARILCVCDGSNGTAYVAEYDGDRREIVPCACIGMEEALQKARAYSGAVCTDEKLAPLLENAIAPDTDCRALLRAATALSEHATAWQELLPVYVRQSQAERDEAERRARGNS